jgi:hypothetical protein
MGNHLCGSIALRSYQDHHPDQLHNQKSSAVVSSHRRNLSSSSSSTSYSSTAPSTPFLRIHSSDPESACLLLPRVVVDALTEQAIEFVYRYRLSSLFNQERSLISSTATAAQEQEKNVVSILHTSEGDRNELENDEQGTSHRSTNDEDDEEENDDDCISHHSLTPYPIHGVATTLTTGSAATTQVQNKSHPKCEQKLDHLNPTGHAKLRGIPFDTSHIRSKQGNTAHRTSLTQSARHDENNNNNNNSHALRRYIREYILGRTALLHAPQMDMSATLCWGSFIYTKNYETIICDPVLRTIIHNHLAQLTLALHILIPLRSFKNHTLLLSSSSLFRHVFGPNTASTVHQDRKHLLHLAFNVGSDHVSSLGASLLSCSSSRNTDQSTINFGAGPPSNPIRMLANNEPFLDLTVIGSLGFHEWTIPSDTKLDPLLRNIVVMNRRSGIPLVVICGSLDRTTSATANTCTLKDRSSLLPVARVYATKRRNPGQSPVTSLHRLGFHWCTEAYPLYPWAEIVTATSLSGTTVTEQDMSADSNKIDSYQSFPSHVPYTELPHELCQYRYSVHLAIENNSFAIQPSYVAQHDIHDSTILRVTGQTTSEATTTSSSAFDSTGDNTFQTTTKVMGKSHGCAIIALVYDKLTSDGANETNTCLGESDNKDDHYSYFQLSVARGIDPALMICLASFVEDVWDAHLRQCTNIIRHEPLTRSPFRLSSVVNARNRKSVHHQHA